MYIYIPFRNNLKRDVKRDIKEKYNGYIQYFN